MNIFLISSLIYGEEIDEMGCMLNVIRRKQGLSKLKIQPKLNEAAKLQSDYQSSIQRMQHQGPGGNRFFQRCKQVGYTGRAMGENVAFNQRSVEGVMDAWMKSEGIPETQKLIFN